MDKETRNAIERATQRARALLGEDFASQLEGTFDILRNGSIAAVAGPHLSPRLVLQRDKIVAAIEHKRAAEMNAVDAIADYLRDAAFTTLNRFVALKMLEARGLVQECITKGEQSSGYREFCGLAPGLPLVPESAGYRLYIESLFDELSTEVKVLFDRRDTSSVLWPKRATFNLLLEILNAEDLITVWPEDETIGWVYQFFNSADDRREARYDAQGKPKAPQNSRELAVRNQFFTPRYVVQFLTDNTLGRIWYEMSATKTALAERCEYMVQKPAEQFSPRLKKDPRDLRVLDPACGSGHFLLYAFDLLLTVYEEAYIDPETPKSEATGSSLADDYPSLNALRRASPGLILAHNLHGVDIDPRCAQIAQLALWMRAQRAYHEYSVTRIERPQIRRSNVVVAEPLVADDQLTSDFLSRLGDADVGRVFTGLLGAIKLAGELGLLLRVETLVAQQAKQGDSADMFAPPEARIRTTLARFATEGEERTNTRRRLFAEDTSQAVGLLALAEMKFDAVLMNPPFGDCTSAAKSLLFNTYGRERIDLGGCFITRFLGLLSTGGRLGVIANRTLLFAATLDEWRKQRLSGATAVVDLGHGVLDALVETAAFTLGNESSTSTLFVGALESSSKSQYLLAAIRAVRNGDESGLRSVSDFGALFGAPFAYWAPTSLIERVARLRRAEELGAIARQGLATCDNFRFLRLAQELPASADSWIPLTKGGEYQPFWAEVPLRVKWNDNGREIKAFVGSLHGQWSRVVQSPDLYGIPGATYSGRTASSLSLRVLPRNSIFDKKGPFVGAATEETSGPFAIGLIGLSYTTPYRFLIETSVGLRDGTTSGSAARDYLPSMIQRLPWPEFSANQWEVLNRSAQAAIEAVRELSSTQERSQYWHEPLRWSKFLSLNAMANARLERWCDLQSRIYEAAEVLEGLGQVAAGIKDKKDYEALEAVAGRSVLTYERRVLTDVLTIQDLIDSSSELLINKLREAGIVHSTIFKKGYWGDRAVELVSHLRQVHPQSVLEAHRQAGASARWCEHTAWRILSAAVALAFGRILPEDLFVETARVVPPDLFAMPRVEPRVQRSAGHDILVDDPGHTRDIITHIEQSIHAHFGSVVDEIVLALGEALHQSGLRGFMARSFYLRHLSEYSDFRRQAPIYWQLATPSTSYSMWLYIHAFTADTLFRLQNEYVAPKLAQEERRLESIARELRGNATAAERKTLALQEDFVEELRTILDEVKRVAPLWKPNLENGVIINFAPLWRLVPQHQPWQKELKATWDALCDEMYDWAPLAMHLWPERVVPKCATDRSLAIAHGLEDAFWVEGSDGKWTERKTMTRPIEELVRERTSPAVKAALRSLLEAPLAANNGGRTRRRRTVANTGQGGSL